MDEDVVSSMVAYTLKLKKFDWECHFYYDEYDSLKSSTFPCNHNTRKEDSSAPSLYMAQKWLRETKNIHIDVYRNASGWLYNLNKADSGTLIVEGKCKGPNDGGAWDVYENCLNVAIANSLESI